MNSEHVAPGGNSGQTLMWALSWASASLSEGYVMGQEVEAVALAAHRSAKTAQAMVHNRLKLKR